MTCNAFCSSPPRSAGEHKRAEREYNGGTGLHATRGARRDGEGARAHGDRIGQPIAECGDGLAEADNAVAAIVAVVVRRDHCPCEPNRAHVPARCRPLDTQQGGTAVGGGCDRSALIGRVQLAANQSSVDRRTQLLVDDAVGRWQREAARTPSILVGQLEQSCGMLE